MKKKKEIENTKKNILTGCKKNYNYKKRFIASSSGKNSYFKTI